MEKVLNIDKVVQMEYSMQIKIAKTKIVGFRWFSSDAEHFIIIKQEDLGYKFVLI